MPEKVSIMHIKAHQKVSSGLEKGNELADRKAKETARVTKTGPFAIKKDRDLKAIAQFRMVPEVSTDGKAGSNVWRKQMSNSSSISHFLLLPLADTRQLQLLHFCLFLGISLAALLANGLIISAVACGHLLHTPMFFFLLNLALTDLGSICTTVPKAMHNSLWDTRNISYTGSLDLSLSVLYSVVPPALNPLIYSLRNQELKAAVWRLVTGQFQKH
ncbi:hypothetical protein DUI87_35471 [Hirundo rustica rustica]|uniref:RNase H type-1 domain-containing protein n=1 Tax=Hirundo rustica rustica TaxID=333673 RepID=A0A3M0IGF8_HIRRU|nr:hypothetical protein DUI87_35471 [Hirundo rustica rustica]